MPPEIETTGPAPVDPAARQHMVPARDGVELATDVYLPENAAACPAVLVRLPYDKSGRYCWMPFISRHSALPPTRGRRRARGSRSARCPTGSACSPAVTPHRTSV